MIHEIDNEEIVLEIRELVNGIDKAKNEMNVYCELVKQMFLSNSNKN